MLFRPTRVGFARPSGLARSSRSVLRVAAVLIAAGCADHDTTLAQRDREGSATETNVAPIRCERDTDCREGFSCARQSADDPYGTCMRISADEDAGAERE